MTGAQNGIAGLANAGGTRVTVNTMGTGASRVASEVIVEKKA